MTLAMTRNPPFDPAATADYINCCRRMWASEETEVEP